VPEELGDGTIELMKEIKKTIDPLNLFNPGKVSNASCDIELGEKWWFF
jgi:D-lactate dehydrogenase (cytochrome)